MKKINPHEKEWRPALSRPEFLFAVEIKKSQTRVFWLSEAEASELGVAGFVAWKMMCSSGDGEPAYYVTRGGEIFCKSCGLERVASGERWQGNSHNGHKPEKEG